MLTAMQQEDYIFLSSLAARYNREISGLIGMVIKSAGGWGETENNLVLEG